MNKKGRKYDDFKHLKFDIFVEKKRQSENTKYSGVFRIVEKVPSNISELCKIRILNCWLKTRQTEVRSAIFTDFFAFFCV